MRLRTSFAKLKGWSWFHESVDGCRVVASGYAFREDRCLREARLAKALLAAYSAGPQDECRKRLSDFVRRKQAENGDQ